jgi:hypothetical protein
MVIIIFEIEGAEKDRRKSRKSRIAHKHKKEKEIERRENEFSKKES